MLEPSIQKFADWHAQYEREERDQQKWLKVNK
jgi:hypothetical protein